MKTCSSKLTELTRWTSILKGPASFYQSIDRLAGPGWLPNDQDILHARVKSTGFSELFFDIGPMTWIMLELGGSRTERRKWIHCFAEVDCLTFVATLSGYDQYLMEDHSAVCPKAPVSSAFDC